MDFYEIIADIQYHVKNNLSLYKKHDTFKKSFPKLFEMLCDSNCDQMILEKLINLHKSMFNNKISLHDASVEFGKVACENYIQPLVNRDTQTTVESKDNNSQTRDKNDNWTHI